MVNLVEVVVVERVNAAVVTETVDVEAVAVMETVGSSCRAITVVRWAIFLATIGPREQVLKIPIQVEQVREKLTIPN